jgi:hypothetical protein
MQMPFQLTLMTMNSKHPEQSSQMTFQLTLTAILNEVHKGPKID